MNQSAIDLLKQIIAIPSYVDETHDESALADLAISLLSQNPNLTVEEQAVEGTRRNLIVTDGTSPKVILFGHLDTVLPKDQTHDPFTPYEEDGKLFGLGAVDMKFGLAIMLDIAINKHKPGIGYVFSVDEEYDFKGANKLRKIDNLKPEYIINLEPTSFKIVNGCRGITEFDFEVYGKSAHAGRKTEGINAIEKTVELISKFESVCHQLDSSSATTSVNLAYLLGGLKTDSTEDVKKMGNVVPNYTKAKAEIRIANQSITEIFVKEKLEEISQELGVEIKNLTFKFYLGSMLTNPKDLALFEQSIVRSGFTPEYADLNQAGYYELQILQSNWGGKCFVFGASPIEKSHTENEYVEIQSVIDTEKVVEDFLQQVLI